MDATAKAVMEVNAAAAARENSDEPAQRCYACGETGHVKSNCTKSIDEAREARELLKSEGLAPDDASSGADGDERAVRALIGEPQSDDTLLHAVPCCAPWSATRKWRYRVKITPGTMKRGAAVKHCVSLFLKETPSQERETQLIKVGILVLRVVVVLFYFHCVFRVLIPTQ